MASTDAENTNVDEEQVLDQPVPPEPEEPETAEAEVEEEATNAAETAEEEEGDEPKPSRREQLRIQKLLEKLKEKEETPAPQPPRRTTTEEDPTEQPDKRRNNWDEFGQRMYNEGLQRAQAIQFHTRLEIDAPRIEAAHPELDPRSEQFNPLLADALNKGYLTMVGYDPKKDTVQNADIRYADYIEAQFELAQEIAGRQVAKTADSVRKQAASTAIRPDGSAPKKLDLAKDPEAMTDEELKAYIARAIPPVK